MPFIATITILGMLALVGYMFETVWFPLILAGFIGWGMAKELRKGTI